MTHTTKKAPPSRATVCHHLASLQKSRQDRFPREPNFLNIVLKLKRTDGVQNGDVCVKLLKIQSSGEYLKNGCVDLYVNVAVNTFTARCTMLRGITAKSVTKIMLLDNSKRTDGVQKAGDVWISSLSYKHIPQNGIDSTHPVYLCMMDVFVLNANQNHCLASYQAIGFADVRSLGNVHSTNPFGSVQFINNNLVRETLVQALSPYSPNIGAVMSNKLKLAVVGSRTFNDILTAHEIISSFDPSIIISGGAKGADSFAQNYAELNAIKCIIHLPDWNKYGKRAGFLRNELIVRDCNHLLAFWDGTSRGTKHSIDLATDAGIPVDVIYFSNDNNQRVERSNA